MKNLKDLVSTNYCDYQGPVAIDRQDMFSENIKDLNLPDGVLISIGVEFGELKGECILEQVKLYFWIALPEYGESIQDIISSGNKQLKVHETAVLIPVSDLGKYIKRFDCCGLYKDLDVDSIEIV